MSETNKTTSEDLYKLLLEDIRITDDKRFKVDKSVEKIRNSIIKGFEEQVFFETEGLGDPVSYKRAAEKSLMYYISSGDIAKVISLINSFDPTENHYQPGEFNDIGEVSENPFLQAMYLYRDNRSCKDFFYFCKNFSCRKEYVIFRCNYQMNFPYTLLLHHFTTLYSFLS